MPTLRGILIWLVILASITVPLWAAAQSPLLAWRDPIYIAAGLAGVLALALLLLQPLLASGRLPGVPMARSRVIHRGVGVGLVAMVVIHVGGLWITSPPDVVDALTFTSPAPFAAWGVIAMWAVFAAALLVALRRRLRLRLITWRAAHTALAVVTVAGTIAHTLLIEGTMEPITKIGLCVMVAAVTAKVIYDLNLWQTALRRKRKPVQR